MKKPEKNLLIKFKDSESSTSIIFGAIVVIVVGILFINFIKSSRTPKVTEQAQTIENSTPQPVAANGFTQPSKLPATYTVARGDHLWGIAEKYFGSGYNYVDIAKVNKNSNHLVAGMSLTIPDVAAKKLTIKTPTAATTLTKATAAPVATAQAISGNSYTVVKGDSLWSIAVRAYGDGYKWTSIKKANAQIKNSGMIDVGWQLTLPR